MFDSIRSGAIRISFINGECDMAAKKKAAKKAVKKVVKKAAKKKAKK